MNFIVQAFRYRGKANYRDALYLLYGDDNQEKLDQFLSDLSSASTSFSLMAAHYINKRVSKINWTNFLADISEHSRFQLPYDLDNI